MKNRSCTLCILMLIFIFTSCKSNSFISPSLVYVPDEATAIRIAEAIWEPLYGKDIYRQRPYFVKLKNEVWIIEGNLNPSLEEVVVGGVAYIEIQKNNGKILKVTHSK